MGIYDECGFEFGYKNGHLGSSDPLDGDFIDDMAEEGKSNEDNLFIYCEMCGTYMDFVEGKNNSLDGKWICPECRRSVRESTPYNQLERENERFLNSMDDDDWDDYDLAQFCHGD